MNKWQRAVKVQKYSVIDSTTAWFMLANHFIIRNSHTKQVASRHYRQGQYPESHGAGPGYAVPIWTVAIKDLHQPAHFGGDADLIHGQIEGFLDTGKVVDGRWEHTLDPALVSASAEAQAAHFVAYVDLIKSFVRDYTAFGRDSFNFYDYELLIEPDSTLRVDDCGRYPTGGRSRGFFRPQSIAYRITFNELEIALFKAVLRGEHDHELFTEEQQRGLSDDVKTSARMVMCNQLATEIIVAKLLMWLNSGGRCQRVIALDDQRVIALDETDRMILLKRAIQNRKEDIDDVTERGLNYMHVARLDQYMIAKKNDDKALTKAFNKAHAEDLEASWSYTFFGRWFSGWYANQPKCLTAILQHACQDTTFFGYHNRTFWVCVALGWLTEAGGLTQEAARQPALKAAFESIARG